MEQITLGDIGNLLAYIAGLGVSVTTIVHFVKKALDKAFVPYGLDNAKNYIVPFIAKFERGEPVSEIELERFHEEYDYYVTHGGNSYVKERVEKLKKDGKL